MKVKKTEWRTYEQLAEKIYSKLDPAAAVKHDDSIYGHDSGTKRQIDVSIRSKVGTHDILVIVQARDRKRAPNVNDVGEFAAVVQDVRAHKGVMVCRKPPGKSAAKLAKTHSIEMCSAFDVNDHKWNEDVAVPVLVSLVEGTLQPDFTFTHDPEREVLHFPNKERTPFVVTTDDGHTQMSLLDYMNMQVIKRGLIQSEHMEFVVKDSSLKIHLGDEWVKLPHLRITAKTKTRKLFRHCKAPEYLALKNYSTGELTVAELKVELPPFTDSTAWKDGTNIAPYEHVTENVPAVQLQHSRLSPAGTMGFRVLNPEDLENDD